VRRGESFEGWALASRDPSTGQECLLSYSGAPVLDARGRRFQSVLVARDISAWARVEALLRHSQKMQAVGLMTAGIAHDFNNVLTVIIGNASLSRRNGADVTQRPELDAILLAARRGATMTARLLALTRRRQAVVLAVHPGTILRGLEPLMRRLLPPSLSLDVDDRTDVSETVAADAASIEQVIIGLFTLAQQSLGESGALSIVCESMWTEAAEGGVPRRRVALSVGDMSRWFEAEGACVRGVWNSIDGATPLGLALVRELMARHDGAVRVGATEARGTVVTVCWPALGEPASAGA
jgi:signal transduction histidine kinase